MTIEQFRQLEKQRAEIEKLMQKLRYVDRCIETGKCHCLLSEDGRYHRMNPVFIEEPLVIKEMLLNYSESLKRQIDKLEDEFSKIKLT